MQGCAKNDGQQVANDDEDWRKGESRWYDRIG